MNTIIVDLNIAREEWLRLYRGESKIVRAISLDGRTVQFPASILSQFTQHHGIKGRFAIAFDPQGKFSSVQRIK